MPNFLAIVTFPDDAEAFKALSDLKSSPVSAVVTASALVQRDADGRVSIPEGGDEYAGDGYLGGSLIGILVGALGGPLGMLLGWGAGGLIGGLSDADRAADQGSVLASAASSIPPGHNALVLQSSEAETASLDHFVSDHGGAVTRLPLEQVLAELEAQQDAAEAARDAAKQALREERKQERHEKWDERVAALKAKFTK